MSLMAGRVFAASTTCPGVANTGQQNISKWMHAARTGAATRATGHTHLSDDIIQPQYGTRRRCALGTCISAVSPCCHTSRRVCVCVCVCRRMGTHLGAHAQQLAGERQHAQHHVRARVVHEDDDPPVRRLRHVCAPRRGACQVVALLTPAPSVYRAGVAQPVVERRLVREWSSPPGPCWSGSARLSHFAVRASSVSTRHGRLLSRDRASLASEHDTLNSY